MENKEYDDELQGYLWHENDSVIHRKGSLLLAVKNTTELLWNQRTIRANQSMSL